MLVIAAQGDTLDAICYRYLGTTAACVEQALALNPGLAALGPVLPQGTSVVLPDTTTTPAAATRPLVQLWD